MQSKVQVVLDIKIPTKFLMKKISIHLEKAVREDKNYPL
jgi:hypothetical protein